MSSVGTIRLLRALVLAGSLCLQTAIADDVPRAYRQVANEHGIPQEIFYAVALTESGKTIESLRRRRPWPWTLNIAGEGLYFGTRWEAWRAIDETLQRGHDSIDIGLMQVNWRFHQDKLQNTWLALEPRHNLRVAAAILRACYRERHDWWLSVGCYHAPSNAERAYRYQQRVAVLWRQVRQS